VANFEPLGTPTTIDTGGDKTAQLAIPEGKSCDACILRWTWQSGDEAAPYINCADVAIKGVDNKSIFCKAGLIKCSSASTLTFSALLALLALLAIMF
jgi:predicted carbohydrate-binding protein with CBM5 and CBM33 domain